MSIYIAFAYICVGIQVIVYMIPTLTVYGKVLVVFCFPFHYAFLAVSRIFFLAPSHQAKTELADLSGLLLVAATILCALIAIGS